MSNLTYSYTPPVAAIYAPVLNASDALATGLIQALLFNEGSGSAVRDHSTNQNHASIVTSTYGAYSWGTDATAEGAFLTLTPTTAGNNPSNADYVDIPATTALNGETYSIVCEFKTSTTTSNGGYANMLIKSLGSSFPYGLRLSNGFIPPVGILVFDVFNGSAVIRLTTGTTTYNDGNWHQAIITRTQGSHTRLYVDGVFIAQATDSFSAGVTQNSADVTLGDYSGAGRAFSGSYSYVYFYNYEFSNGSVTVGNAATSGSQVYDMYHNPKRMWVAPTTASATANLTSLSIF